MADNKSIFWIFGIFLAVILLFRFMPQTTFSTYSFEGLSEGQCSLKETSCFNWNNLRGQLIDCKIGSENKCYCEFRSYSRNECPSGATEIKSSTATITYQDGRQIITTAPKEEIKTSFDWQSVPIWGWFILILLIVIIFMGGILKGKE